MGYALAYGPCICCSRPFGYNPVHVPSSSAITGRREPICRECVVRINAVRKQAGSPLIIPHPMAWEPCHEEELGD